MKTFGGIRHLARRFGSSLRARHPGVSDQRFAAHHLLPSEERLFWSQPTADIAHALAVARRVAAERPEDRDLVRAALLHDVGKGPARLGVLGRTAATVVRAARLPPSGRLRVYLDHGQIGADLLERAGVDGLPVAFARHHRDPTPPDGVDPADWALLRRADHEA